MKEIFVNQILPNILPNILEIVITIISIIIARYLIPYIKNDLIPFFKDKKIYNTIKQFVQAAEKMGEAGIIAKSDKKKKVIELLEKNGIIVDETIEAFIESCVKELDMVSSVFFEEMVKDNEDNEDKESNK